MLYHEPTQAHFVTAVNRLSMTLEQALAQAHVIYSRTLCCRHGVFLGKRIVEALLSKEHIIFTTASFPLVENTLSNGQLAFEGELNTQHVEQ